MKYPRILFILSVFAFMGIGATGIKLAVAEEWSASFEAFKSTDDPAYHQRHDGNIDWNLFHDSAEAEAGKPIDSDIYWIEGDLSWQKRIAEVKDTSAVDYMTPANVDQSKYHSPCPLCGYSTYFWLSDGILDSDTVSHIKGDFPDWSSDDRICRYCFECYLLRTGKFFEGFAASTTDEYVIGYNKSPGILDYFRNVK